MSPGWYEKVKRKITQLCTFEKWKRQRADEYRNAFWFIASFFVNRKLAQNDSIISLYYQKKRGSDFIQKISCRKCMDGETEDTQIYAIETDASEMYFQT